MLEQLELLLNLHYYDWLKFVYESVRRTLRYDGVREALVDDARKAG